MVNLHWFYQLASASKTRVALDTIELLTRKTPNLSVLVVVPTEVLKEQWIDNLISRNLLGNCDVEIINSVIKKD